MPQTITIVNDHNRCYEVEPHDVVQRTWHRGIYQITSLRYLRQLCPQARRIIDVGANVGTNTIEYSTWAQHVEAFEPSDFTRQLLVQNIAHNRTREPGRPWWGASSMAITGQIQVHGAAVTNRNSQAWIVHREQGLADYVREDQGDQQCQTRTLDSYGWPDVDIIKADTEGTEWLVIQGADQTIRASRPIVQVEMWGWERRLGLDNHDMLAYFRDLGYLHLNNRGESVPWTAAGRWNLKAARAHGQKRSAMDRFFVPPELL